LDIKNYLEREKKKFDDNKKFETKLQKIAEEETLKAKERKLEIARKEQLR
jgi:hypothetical protein